MISKKYLYKNDVFGNKAEDIEGFVDAMLDTELYVPHHVLEFKYSKQDLIRLDRYWCVTPDELIWVRRSIHNNNAALHIDVKRKNSSTQVKCNMSNAQKTQYWFNNGEMNVRSNVCPLGFVAGRVNYKRKTRQKSNE